MTNGISINAGFDVGSANPIDTRQWLSTAEMKTADVNTMPDPYFAINKEDHFLYIFSKTNTISESTGYFTKYTNDGGMTVWKGSEAERDALPEETKADESIIFYTWDTASAEYKNVVSKTVGTVENMSEADYQALATKDARTIYTTETGVRVGENVITFNAEECLAKAKSTGWWRYGEAAHLPSGLIRSGYIPKKIVFLGNSFTAHRPVEQGAPEGYLWPVYDWRAMAASTPTSDWTQIVRNKLKEINPCIKAYKASVIAWEGSTLGERSYNDFKDELQCAEILDDGGHYLSNTSIDDILTDDVDVIIWQAYENMAAPDITSETETKKFTEDFKNVFTALRNKCPKATIYDYCGWWTNTAKDQCIVSACAMSDVEVIWQWDRKLLAWKADSNIYLQAKENDQIYDGDGNLLCAVDNSVAGHANDLGHKYIAFYVLNRLFNGASDTIPELTLGVSSSDRDMTNSSGFFDKEYYECAVYYNAETIGTPDISLWTDFDGIYVENCINVIIYIDRRIHATFGCKILEKRANYGAMPTIQELVTYSGVAGDYTTQNSMGNTTYRRTWRRDKAYNQVWEIWVQQAICRSLRKTNTTYNTQETTFLFGDKQLIIKQGNCKDQTTGRITFVDEFPNALYFVGINDTSGGYKRPTSAGRANYIVETSQLSKSSFYVHTMEIAADGTVTVDATVPAFNWVAIGY